MIRPRRLPRCAGNARSGPKRATDAQGMRCDRPVALARPEEAFSRTAYRICADAGISVYLVGSPTGVSAREAPAASVLWRASFSGRPAVMGFSGLVGPVKTAHRYAWVSAGRRRAPSSSNCRSFVWGPPSARRRLVWAPCGQMSVRCFRLGRRRIFPANARMREQTATAPDTP